MSRPGSALITGSTSGIGLAIASELAALGHNLMLIGFGDSDEIESTRFRLASLHGEQAWLAPIGTTDGLVIHDLAS